MALDTKNVQYNGVNTDNIPMQKGQALELILQNIDTSINTHNTAPNYSTYNLGPYFGYTVTETDGVTHPTNTQNFAEGISKILGKTQSDLYTFTGTTYVTNQGVLTTAINGLQLPSLTYAPFSITNGMTVTQVWNASFTGFTAILAALNPSGGNWGTLSITPPTTVTTGFNSLIAYLSTLTTTVSGKQATIATINNSANVLTGSGGTSTDTVRTTATLLTTYVTTLPTFSSGSITWGCVSSASGLQNTMQSAINSISSLITNTVVAAGTGLSIATVGSCLGKSLAINPAYTQLYKVMVTGDAYTDANVLDQKITSGDGSITLSVTGNKLDLSVTTPATNKVKINASDSTANYLANKIPSSSGTWGLAIISQASGDNSTLVLTPQVNNGNLLAQNLMSLIQDDPTLLIQFSNLVASSQNVPGAGITDLVVTKTGSTFVYTWTAQSGNSQQAKHRPRSSNLWYTNDLSPADPLSAVAVTTTQSSVPINDPQQFQVDTVYNTGLIGSNIYECIKYTCQADTHGHVGGVINISQSAMTTIDIIEYRLILNAGSVLQQTIITDGNNPAVAFNSVGAGTYHVEWRYGTLINGATLYSDDASQLNAMCSSSNIVIT